MNIYEEIDTLEVDARLWENRAQNLGELLREARCILFDLERHGSHPSYDELRGFIAIIDEELDRSL